MDIHPEPFQRRVSGPPPYDFRQSTRQNPCGMVTSPQFINQPTMNFQEYLHYFEQVLNQEVTLAPYDKPDYFNYTKLNWSRMNRWLKTAELSEATKASVAGIREPQQWIVITEPWCGDAAHIVPFIQMMSLLNPMVTVDYELRDSEPHRIAQYLTNGGKSIPKLIIRNSQGTDLAVWGPRPAKCQEVYASLHAQNTDSDTLKAALQNWYNADKGQEIQAELRALLNAVPAV